jgi:hypothetical protein
MDDIDFQTFIEKLYGYFQIEQVRRNIKDIVFRLMYNFNLCCWPSLHITHLILFNKFYANVENLNIECTITICIWPYRIHILYQQHHSK